MTHLLHSPLWTSPRLCLFTVTLAITPAYAQENAGNTNPPPVDQATSIASITADRGIVTRPGRFTIEPSLSYSHSNSTLVAIEGYTVIPALLIGLINVSEVQRDTFVGAVSLKYGFTSRLEAAVRVPYLSINEDLRERKIFDDTPIDTLQESSGNGLGDVELSTRYQLNDGVEGWPYIIGVFRVRAPTGEGPYDVKQRIVRDENSGTVLSILLDERPTGSGFWSFEPGFSFIYPSDPAVLFGNLSYVWTVEEDAGPDNGGTIDPGDIVRLGFGMGFAFNERTSFSLGYDHSVIGKTRFERENPFDATFDRFHVGSLSFGLAHRLSNSTTLSLSVSVGVTENAPNSEITLKLPLSL